MNAKQFQTIRETFEHIIEQDTEFSVKTKMVNKLTAKIFRSHDDDPWNVVKYNIRYLIIEIEYAFNKNIAGKYKLMPWNKHEVFVNVYNDIMANKKMLNIVEANKALESLHCRVTYEMSELWQCSLLDADMPRLCIAIMKFQDVMIANGYPDQKYLRASEKHGYGKLYL